MPNYIAKCKSCGKIFKYSSTISARNEPLECDCGGEAKRDWEAEFAPGGMTKMIIGDRERWSVSMGVPPSQIEEFRKRFSNSVYDNKGRLLIKNRKDKLRQMKERDFQEYSEKESLWKK